MARLDLLAIEKSLHFSEALQWFYEETPCSFYRFGAAKDLIAMGEASDDLLSECAWDCDPDTRRLVGAES